MTAGKRMPRIMFIEATRNGVVGGSVVCLCRMVRELHRMGYECCVVLRSDLPIRGEIEKYARVFLLPRIEKRRRSNSRPAAWAGWIRDFLMEDLPGTAALLRIIRREKVDIVHLNNGLGFDHDGILAARLTGARCIVHERGFMKLSAVSRWLSRYVDTVVCVSDAVLRHLKDQKPASRTVRKVYDGVDPGEIENSGSARRVRDELGIPPSEPVVGLIGTVQPWKGHRELLHAVRTIRWKFPKIRCIFAGGIYDPEYEMELRNAVKDWDIENQILFLGYRSDVLDVMRALDVVVHASILPEPFGMVLIEAMALKKPVVATRAGGPLEIIEDGASGILVESGDSEGLADAILRLLENPSLANQMGCAGRERVDGMFPLSQAMKEITGIYGGLL